MVPGEVRQLMQGSGVVAGLGALLEFAPYAVGFDGLFVPIPCKSLNTDHGEIAAETTETFDQRYLCSGPSRRQRSGQAPRARTNDQDLGLMDDTDIAGWFVDRGCGVCHRVLA